MIRVLVQSVYYQLLMFLRIKHAVFFSLIFPVFLLIVFGSIWGGPDNPYYVPFVLPGILGMTILSDGLFAIGPTVKEYYSSGLIKYLRKLPFNILYHFIGLILSRIISLIFIIILLCLTAKLMFNYSTTFTEFINLIRGTFIGLFVFSFMGLVITFTNIKPNSDTGITNIAYFTTLFTSHALYEVGNDTVKFIGNILPLNAIVDILRGGEFRYSIIIWLVITIVAFYYLFNKVKFNR